MMMVDCSQANLSLLKMISCLPIHQLSHQRTNIPTRLQLKKCLGDSLMMIMMKMMMMMVTSLLELLSRKILQKVGKALGMNSISLINEILTLNLCYVYQNPSLRLPSKTSSQGVIYLVMKEVMMKKMMEISSAKLHQLSQWPKLKEPSLKQTLLKRRSLVFLSWFCYQNMRS